MLEEQAERIALAIQYLIEDVIANHEAEKAGYPSHGDNLILARREVADALRGLWS